MMVVVSDQWDFVIAEAAEGDARGGSGGEKHGDDDHRRGVV